MNIYMKRIAFIMWSNGLEYDDRVRKEIKSIKSFFPNIEISIFAIPGDNIASRGITSYGVQYELFPLKSRELFSKGFLLIKVFEFYYKVRKRISSFDLLWIIDDQVFLFLLLSYKKMIWDLHEIPTKIIGSRLKNYLFIRMQKRCSAVIHANDARISYLNEIALIRNPGKHFVLRNYPDHDWLVQDNSFSEEFNNFKKWIDEEGYIYLQGVNSNNRYAIETLSSVIEAACLKAVVLGNVQDEVMQDLRNKYGEKLAKWLYFVGQVKQQYTASFIAHSKFSIIYYSLDTPNNRFCEPNRLFHCLALSKPVIVGCNPTMKSVVEYYKVGIVQDSDGSDINENIASIKKMIHNYNEYLENAKKYHHIFLWEAQNKTFFSILEVLSDPR